MSYNTKQHRLPNKPPKERNNMPEKITIPLSEKYTNPAEIFLDTGIAYKIANKMGVTTSIKKNSKCLKRICNNRKT